jgi:uncharacterized protein with ATP-grasp and redox domains
MEIFLDCLPCILRQVLEASRMATDRQELQAGIMEESMEILSDYKKYGNSPALVKAMHQAVKRRTGVQDPYQAVKWRDLHAAREAYPALKQFLQTKDQELYWALKIAATGNIIDSAIYSDLYFLDCMEAELSKPFAVCDLDCLKEQLKTAKKLLIIGDNAGETVFDRLLAERLSEYDITYAVRAEPIINDATTQDAYESGLNDYAAIITTGSGAPGAVLDDCSDEFLNVFYGADIVISKGQGNFEALSGCDRPVFFLLKAKCSMVARRLGIALNHYVFKYEKADSSRR